MGTVKQIGAAADKFSAISSATKDWLNVEKAASEAVNSVEDVEKLTKAISAITKFGSAFSAVGAALGFINMFLPSPTDAILNKLDVISDQITDLQDDLDSKFNDLASQNKINTAKNEIFGSKNSIATANDSWTKLRKKLRGIQQNSQLDQYMKMTNTEVDEKYKELHKSVAKSARDKLFNAYIEFAKSAIVPEDIEAFKTNLEGSENLFSSIYDKSKGDLHAVIKAVKLFQSKVLLGIKLMGISERMQAKPSLNSTDENPKSALDAKTNQPNFERNILPVILDRTSGLDVLVSDLNAYNNQVVDKNPVLQKIETEGNKYINMCTANWTDNALNYLSNSPDINLPSDAKDSPNAILNSLVSKYPFVDWMVIVVASKSDADVCQPMWNHISDDKDILVHSFMPWTPFKTKYPSYFKNDYSPLNLFVWGYMNHHNTPLKQFSYQKVPNAIKHYSDSDFHGPTASQQYKDIIKGFGIDFPTGTNFPDGLLVVHLNKGLIQEFGIRYATNNPYMYFATPYDWDNDRANATFNGRDGIDVQVASHPGNYDRIWVDPFIMVYRMPA